jgi:hypothetical protein
MDGTSFSFLPRPQAPDGIVELTGSRRYTGFTTLDFEKAMNHG